MADDKLKWWKNAFYALVICMPPVLILYTILVVHFASQSKPRNAKSSRSGIACGANTAASGGKCVVASSACGAGTRLKDGKCAATMSCGADTEESGGKCVVSHSACGPGARLKDGKCVPSQASPSPTCGPGTTEFKNVKNVYGVYDVGATPQSPCRN